MTPKELKRLSRSDLLEMMLELSKENEALRAEAERLRTQLHDKMIAVENCGSLAEAALQLNGLFQAAEAACAQYTENIQARSADLEAHCQRMEHNSQERCRQMEQGTEERCRQLTREMEERCRSMEEETEARCRKAESDTRQKCEDLIRQTQEKAKAFVEAARKQRQAQEQEYLWLKELMNDGEAE